MRKMLVLGLLAFATSTFAQGAPASMPAAPPEVQKTVDAFLGKWSVDGKLMAPGLEAPVPMKLTIECQKTALGAAVRCSATGEATGLGPMEMGLMIGYNPEEKLVHLMAITSSGEFHDHKGVWKDASTLAFEPLKFTAKGKEATEDLSFTFASDKAMSFESVTTLADGSKESFGGQGTR